MREMLSLRRITDCRRLATWRSSPSPRVAEGVVERLKLSRSM